MNKATELAFQAWVKATLLNTDTTRELRLDGQLCFVQVDVRGDFHAVNYKGESVATIQVIPRVWP
jgi:hypothetical protein